MITSEPRVGPILKLLAAFTSAETGAGWVLVMEGSNTGASHQCWLENVACCPTERAWNKSLVVDQYKIKIFLLKIALED